jgi:hypothetical protein
MDYFKDRTLVIATMHKKEKIIKPILEKELWVKCIIVENFNTDKFGTFTQDIKRSGDMLTTARLKVQHAMDISWCDLGISSEWSFWSHHWIPFINSNFELTLLVDKKNDIEIKWHHMSTDTNLNWVYVHSVAEALTTAKSWWFPEHGIIVRFSKNYNFLIDKNIHNERELEQAVKKILSLPFVNTAYIETDMRANKNPTRMKNIELSIIDLVNNIHSLCPQCWIPWFSIIDREKWLPCWECGTPTNLPLYNIYDCNKCHFSKKVRNEKKYAPAWMCPHCNP